MLRLNTPKVIIPTVVWLTTTAIGLITPNVSNTKAIWAWLLTFSATRLYLNLEESKEKI